MTKNRFFSISFIFFSWIVYGILVALAIWTQVYPQGLKSLIFHRFFLEGPGFGNLIICLIFSFVSLFFVNIVLAKLKHLQGEKSLNLLSCFSNQTKAMWPLLLLFLYSLRAFVFFGGESAWIQDQTGFYFLVFFILILAWAMSRLIKGIGFNKQSFLKEGISKFTLVFFFISFILFFSYFSILRLWDLRIEKPDSHVYMTALWNTVHGSFLRYTYLDSPRNWFGLHFEPVLLFFVPLYLMKIPDTLMPALLQFVQVVIGVSGVFPVFFLARKKLKSAFLGLVFGLVYLLFPAFQFQVLYDFHIEIICLVSVLWCIYFLEEKRYKQFLFFLVLAVFSREEFALFASIFGLFCLFKKGYDKRVGIFLLPAGFLYLLLVKSLIIPYFGQGDLVPAQVSMFSHLQENLFKNEKSLFFKLEYILSFIFTQRKIQYLFLMFLPMGFLAMLSPFVLFTLPFFLINLLLNFDLPSSILWHYQSWLIPILIWAAIDFVSKKQEITKNALCVFLWRLLFSRLCILVR